MRHVGVNAKLAAAVDGDNRRDVRRRRAAKEHRGFGVAEDCQLRVCHPSPNWATFTHAGVAVLRRMIPPDVAAEVIAPRAIARRLASFIAWVDDVARSFDGLSESTTPTAGTNRQKDDAQ